MRGLLTSRGPLSSNTLLLSLLPNHPVSCFSCYLAFSNSLGITGKGERLVFLLPSLVFAFLSLVCFFLLFEDWSDSLTFSCSLAPLTHEREWRNERAARRLLAFFRSFRRLAFSRLIVRGFGGGERDGGVLTLGKTRKLSDNTDAWYRVLSVNRAVHVS